jgi:hypothetical protein
MISSSSRTGGGDKAPVPFGRLALVLRATAALFLLASTCGGSINEVSADNETG